MGLEVKYLQTHKPPQIIFMRELATKLPTRQEAIEIATRMLQATNVQTKIDMSDECLVCGKNCTCNKDHSLDLLRISLEKLIKNPKIQPVTATCIASVGGCGGDVHGSDITNMSEYETLSK